jgi:HPt (histidine-containing phosphotransfer) domain-containing protein
MKMVERVMTAFHDTGNANLMELKAAVDVSNFEDVAQISHRFKGSASNVSAIRLHVLLKKIESLAKDQNKDELPAVLIQLQSEWAEFDRFSKGFIPATTTRPIGLDRQKPPTLETSHASACCGR